MIYVGASWWIICSKSIQLTELDSPLPSQSHSHLPKRVHSQGWSLISIHSLLAHTVQFSQLQCYDITTQLTIHVVYSFSLNDDVTATLVILDICQEHVHRVYYVAGQIVQLKRTDQHHTSYRIISCCIAPRIRTCDLGVGVALL